MVAGLLAEFLRQRFDARQVVLEVAAGHHAGGHFEANFALGRAHRDGLQIRQEGMVLLGSAKVPRAAMRVAAAVAFHRADPGHLTNSGHNVVSLGFDHVEAAGDEPLTTLGKEQ